VEELLVAGFSDQEKAAIHDYVRRMRANIEAAQHEFEMKEMKETKEMKQTKRIEEADK
jgi:hypothetical protein